eukprot:920205-Rhodomonas_salina.2
MQQTTEAGVAPLSSSGPIWGLRSRTPETRHKKPQCQCNLYQECGFLYLISGGKGVTDGEGVVMTLVTFHWHALNSLLSTLIMPQ